MAVEHAGAHRAPDSASIVPDAHNIAVRALTLADLVSALQLGLEDFRAKPSHMMMLGLLYVFGAGIAAGVALDQDLLPLAFPAVGGLALMGPAAAIVLYEISRRKEQGRDFAWSDIGNVFKNASAVGIAVLCLALIAVFGLWMVTAQAIFAATIGAVDAASPMGFLRTILSTEEGWRLILIGNFVGFLFAAVVLATNIVSFPMLLDRDIGAPAAVATSLRVTAKNPFTVAVWGLIVAVLLVAGTTLFLVGLAVIVPVLGHASWHLYRKAVAN